MRRMLLGSVHKYFFWGGGWVTDILDAETLLTSPSLSEKCCFFIEKRNRNWMQKRLKTEPHLLCNALGDTDGESDFKVNEAD